MEDNIIISSDNSLLKNIVIEFDNGFRKSYMTVFELIEEKEQLEKSKSILETFVLYAQKIVEIANDN